MPDNTMPRRKAQAKPYDDLAISRAISAVDDPKLRAFLESVADVVTAISGNQQVRNVEQRQTLAAEIATERQHVYETLRDVRYQVAEGNKARKANADQVAEGISLILKEQESAKQGLALLADQFRQAGEALNEWQGGMEQRVTTVEEALAARPSLEETRELIALLRKHDQQIAVLESRLDARPSPEKAQATYEGVRRILSHLGLEGGE